MRHQVSFTGPIAWKALQVRLKVVSVSRETGRTQTQPIKVVGAPKRFGLSQHGRHAQWQQNETTLMCVIGIFPLWTRGVELALTAASTAVSREV